MLLAILVLLFIWLLAIGVAAAFVVGIAPAGEEEKWLEEAARNIQWPIGYEPQ